MVQTNNAPPFDLQAYEPPICLWHLVQQYVPEHEREEIKNMLGESLIDQSLELHLEIDTLLDIWRDYREETTHCKTLTLPEPPGVRDRLVQEIQFFVENVKDKAKTQGVNPDKILSRHNTDILDYALDGGRPDSARPSSRMLTARSSDGRETPMITSPTGSDRISAASSISEEVESMNDKLTVLKFDEVVNHLRSTLEEEVETLMKDINFLQNCLDDEATFRAESQGTISREPTLAELKEERSTLEKDLLSDMKSQTSPTLKPTFNQPAIIKPIGPGITSSSKMKTSVNSDPKRSGPVKAFTNTDNQGSIHPAHVPSAPCRPKTKDTSSTDTGTSVLRRPNVGHRHISADKPKVVLPNSPVNKHIGNISGSKSNETIKSSESSNSSNRLRIDRKEKLSSEHLGLVQPTSIEAARGPYKSAGSSGESETTLTPSPPASKPTTPRPSSATRFRKMVMECRD